MSNELFSILVLVVIFLIGTTLGINMGVFGIVAAFAVGTALGVSEDDIFAGFPGDLFVILVGITFLFGIASLNGTVDWLIHASVRAVGGRTAAIPWVFFGVTAVLTASGRGRAGGRRDHRADRAGVRRAVRHQPGADGADDHQRRHRRRLLADQRVRLDRQRRRRAQRPGRERVPPVRQLVRVQPAAQRRRVPPLRRAQAARPARGGRRRERGGGRGDRGRRSPRSIATRSSRWSASSR